ncbi:MAG TPA: MOSC domain-containing protein [Candidatus Nitrosopolaris sp.]|nr:MOSC domain-containing protein [Candidatus Nitrosopolaris sp.]
MKVLSVNVSLPREVLFNGQVVITGIFKEPVQGRINLHKVNLDGDAQADLTVHGGIDKAVYSYPVEHYEFWQRQLPDTRMACGMFGENLTTEGLMEDAVNIGDRFQIGSAKLVATQPRMPCYKLGVKFGRLDIVRQFLDSGRPGIYFRVLQEGKVGAGDSIHLIKRNKNNITVNDIVHLFAKDKKNIEMMQRATRIKDLPAGWKFHFLERISEIDRSTGVNGSIAK